MSVTHDPRCPRLTWQTPHPPCWCAPGGYGTDIPWPEPPSRPEQLGLFAITAEPAGTDGGQQHG